jgi:hypothetical protein
MSKITIKIDIELPDDEHCRNPRSKEEHDRCRHMRWVSYGAYCELYEQKILEGKDETIRRPTFCRDSEVRE